MAKIKKKPCLHGACLNAHKSEGDYCAEHAHEADQPKLSRNLLRFGQGRACSSPHLAEEVEYGIDVAWSLKRNVL
jgi:hypothetical protein